MHCMLSCLVPSWKILTYFNQFSVMLTWRKVGLRRNKILLMWRSLEINEFISSCGTNLLTNDPISLMPFRPCLASEWAEAAFCMRALFFRQCRWHLNSFTLNGISNVASAQTDLYPVNGIRSHMLVFTSGSIQLHFSHNLRVGDKLVLFCKRWEAICGMRWVDSAVNRSNGLMG